jgi:hypothetical protein
MDNNHNHFLEEGLSRYNSIDKDGNDYAEAFDEAHNFDECFEASTAAEKDHKGNCSKHGPQLLLWRNWWYARYVSRTLKIQSMEANRNYAL